MELGYLHIYTGDGKGKTTAATGLAARAVMQGLRVGFIQFMKSGASGEVVALAKIGATVIVPQAGDKFSWEMTEEEKAVYREKQRETLHRAKELENRFDLLILDEALSAVDAGMIQEKELLEFVKTRLPDRELVLTGRNASKELLALADYATEMKMLAHPFEKGVKARRGIEY